MNSIKQKIRVGLFVTIALSAVFTLFSGCGNGLIASNPSAASSVTPVPNVPIENDRLQVVTLVSIAVTSAKPCKEIAANGGTMQFTATGTYSDSTTADITSTVNWTSSDPNVTFNSTGMATANDTVGTSSVTLTATDPSTSIAGSTSVPVVILASIQISAAGGATSVPLNGTLQFTATVTYPNDSCAEDITTQVTWTSSNPSYASINSSGLLTAGNSNRTVNITAHYVNISSSNDQIQVGNPI